MKRVYVNEDWCLACHLCEYYCAAANSGAENMIKAFANGKKPIPRIKVEEGSGIILPCSAVTVKLLFA